jgi:predicted AAA+ superfamily ATPase
MIPRILAKELKLLSKQYKVVSLFGPRQSGKTTLVKKIFPNKKYYSLEYPDTKTIIDTDPRGFLNQIPPSGVILDEIQRSPKLLSYIQGIVDEKNKKGLFILTGSHQPSLNQTITQSLAGRTSLSTLYPLTLNELPEIEKNIFHQIYKGFYPGLISENLEVNRFYQFYIKSYVERDLRQMIQVKDLNNFQTFLKLLAGRTGQTINFSSLGNDVGVNDKTIKEWISILEASYIIFVLPPYFKNFGKRVIKAPKIYFTDTGLLCHLLGIREKSQVERDPLRGNIFENLLIADIYKRISNTGDDILLYFLKDSNGNEIDLIYEHQRIINLIEIKSSSTFNSEMLKGLLALGKLFQEQRINKYLLYNGKDESSINGCKVLNFKNFNSNL